MSLSGWLRTREPAAPPHLLDRVEALLAGGATDAAPADALVRAARAVVAAQLRDGATDRAAALDLLAADALVTYAFEAAADEPGTLEARCEAAMREVSDVAGAA